MAIDEGSKIQDKNQQSGDTKHSGSGKKAGDAATQIAQITDRTIALQEGTQAIQVDIHVQLSAHSTVIEELDLSHKIEDLGGNPNDIGISFNN